MFGIVTLRHVCRIDAPSVLAASSSSLPISCEHRHDLADRERDADEDRHEHHRRHREEDLDAAGVEERVEPAAEPEQDRSGEPHGDRRQRERQIDERVQQRLAGEALPHEHPRRDHAEERGHDQGDDRDDPGQEEGVLHVGPLERLDDLVDQPGLQRRPDDADERAAAAGRPRTGNTAPTMPAAHEAALRRCRAGPCRARVQRSGGTRSSVLFLPAQESCRSPARARTRCEQQRRDRRGLDRAGTGSRAGR